LWAATETGCVLALLLPVRITLINGLLRRLTTRSVVYGSVLCAPGTEGRKGLVRLLKTYTEETDGELIFTELRNLSDLGEIQAVLNDYGFSYSDHLNYLIDLNRSTQAIFQDIGRRTRKHIRRGLRRGELVIEEVSEREGVTVCHELIRRSYQAAHVPLADRSLFEAAFDQLYAKRMVKFTLARVNQIPVSASVELLYKDVIFGWYGGVNRAFRSYTSSEILTWHILRWGADNGYRLYDFGGAGEPDKHYGVRDFKAKFGGNLVCYGRNTYVHSPTLFRLSKQGYRFLRWCL
jgi:hypothetical protein